MVEQFNVLSSTFWLTITRILMTYLSHLTKVIRIWWLCIVPNASVPYIIHSTWPICYPTFISRPTAGGPVPSAPSSHRLAVSAEFYTSLHNNTASQQQTCRIVPVAGPPSDVGSADWHRCRGTHTLRLNHAINKYLKVLLESAHMCRQKIMNILGPTVSITYYRDPSSLRAFSVEAERGLEAGAAVHRVHRQ